jgi:hypothetical protein
MTSTRRRLAKATPIAHAPANTPNRAAISSENSMRSPVVPAPTQVLQLCGRVRVGTASSQAARPAVTPATSSAASRSQGDGFTATKAITRAMAT